jgi:hypothetical protein
MAILIFNLGIAGLSGWAIDYLYERRKLLYVAAGLALFGAGILIFLRPADDRTFTVALTSLLGAGALAAIRGRFAPAAIGLVVLLELSTICGALFPNRHDENRPSYLAKMPEAADVVEFLRRQPQPLRVDINDEDVPYNFGDFYGVEQTSGYLASLTSNMLDIETHTERTHQLFGVGYLIAKKPNRPNQTPIYDGRQGLRLFASPGALPRARVVRNLVHVPDRKGLAWFIADPSNDLTTTAVMVTQPPQLAQCAGRDEIRFLHRSSDDVRMRARLACRGMLVLADTYFPGWRATVDGRAVPIHEVYGALRGVVVDGGEHTIEMTYRPWTVTAGAILTFAGLASGLILWLIGRR